MPVDIEAFHDARTGTISYLLVEPAARVAAVIDPVLGLEPATGRIDELPLSRLERRLRERQATLAWLLETHVHADHLSGAERLRARHGGAVVIGNGIFEVWSQWRPLLRAGWLPPTLDGCIGARFFDCFVGDGDVLALGAARIEVIETPGHTPDGVSYRVDDAVFVGDTLFMPPAGTARCDFPGGDAARLYRSIRRLLALPPATRLFTGHDYGHERGRLARWESTVAEQRAHNVQVGGDVTEADYVALRTARDRDLKPPALLAHAVPFNLRGGRPPAERLDAREALR